MVERFSTNALAAVLNALVIHLSLTSKEIESHFKYFIANTAFLGMLMAVGHFTMALIFSIKYGLNLPVTVSECSVLFLLTFPVGVATLCSYVNITACRYNEIVLRRECSKFKIVSQIIFPYLIPVAYFLVYGLFASHVHTFGPFCMALHFSNIWFHYARIAIVALSFGFQIYYSVRLHKFLNGHFKKVRSNLHRARRRENEKLEDEKNILKTILIQGVSPMFLALPYILSIIVSTFLKKTRNFDTSILSKQAVLFNGYYKISVETTLVFIASLNPLIDSLAVPFVLKSYRRAREKFERSLFSKLLRKKSNRITPTFYH